MNITTEDVNDAQNILEQNFLALYNELLNILDQCEYQMQASHQRERMGNTIFSPSITNKVLKTFFENYGWEANVPLLNPGYNTGKDVDFYKDGIVVEVQFAHYALMTSDAARLEALFNGNMRLVGDRPVNYWCNCCMYE